MTPVLALKAATLCALVATPLLCGADLSNYRGFQLGSNLAAVAQQAEMKPTDARLVHQRPAAIQELDWRRGYASQDDPNRTDPVREVLLRFYNGDLFQIVATYDRQMVEGMSETDMVDAISLTYGTATRPAAEIAYHSNYGEAVHVIARWENPECSYNLVRTGDRASFALILSLKRLDDLAQPAIIEAARLEVLEAPQRAIDLQKKKDAEGRLALDQARSVNIPNFRP
jgi:hypothetical protein